jgi:hypothetical protein
MDFLQQFLSQLGLPMANNEQAGEEAAMAIRKNGAPSTGIYDQNYASHLRNRADSGGLFSALDAQALFNSADRERANLAEAAKLQREQELAVSRDRVAGSVLPAWLNNLPEAERFGVNMQGMDSYAQMDPVTRMVGRATMQDKDEADIFKTKTEGIDKLVQSGYPVQRDWLQDALRGVTETGRMQADGTVAFPDIVGDTARNNYSPDNLADLEKSQISANATVAAANARGARDSDDPVKLKVSTIPGTDGRVTNNTTFEGTDAGAIAAAIKQAEEAGLTRGGAPAEAPQARPMPPAQSSRFIDTFRKNGLLPKNATVMDHRVYDTPTQVVVTDLNGNTVLMLPKGAR